MHGLVAGSAPLTCPQNGTLYIHRTHFSLRLSSLLNSDPEALGLGVVLNGLHVKIGAETQV